MSVYAEAIKYLDYAKGVKLLDQANELLLGSPRSGESSMLKSSNSFFLTRLDEVGDVRVVSDDTELVLSGLRQQAGARDCIERVAGISTVLINERWEKNLKITKDGENLAVVNLSSATPPKIQDDAFLFRELFARFGIDLSRTDGQAEGIDLFEATFKKRIVENLGAISLSDGSMLSCGVSATRTSEIQADGSLRPKVMKRFLELSGDAGPTLRVDERSDFSRGVFETEYRKDQELVRARKVAPHMRKALGSVAATLLT